MSKSLVKVTLHIVFSTKKRATWLKDAEDNQRLYAYLATCLKTLGSPALIINGTSDHVHALCQLSRNHAIKDVLSRIKADSSYWIKRVGPTYRRFAWQSGYGAFSVSESNIDDVRRYIANQQEHHRQRSFQDEFRALCRRHGVQLDERYAWD